VCTFLARTARPSSARCLPGVAIDAPLSVREAGFSLHAATRAGPADEQGRQSLLKYILRPPLANERLLPGPDGLVRIALKKPFSDGTVAVDLDPLSLLCRLVALVPAPRFHTVRYFGVLAPSAKWRPLRRVGVATAISPHPRLNCLRAARATAIAPQSRTEPDLAPAERNRGSITSSPNPLRF